MAFCGKWPVRCKLIVDNQLIEQVSKFMSGCQLSYQGEVEIQLYVRHNKTNSKKQNQNGNTSDFIK
jgi:hypothetical protein